jgi:sterol desaturase/sphingolipid hydroxylase (fatty acid hydroxylase superfamily)
MSSSWVIDYSLMIRLVIFMSVLLLLGWWETKDTWRSWLVSRKDRWVKHLSLIALSQLAMKVIFPVLPVGIAMAVQEKHIGLFHQMSLPLWGNIILGVIILDGMMYWQHRLLHRYRWLWRLHQVHHMDRQIDVTTGLRFHPIEMLFTMTVKIAAIGFFGIDYLGVMLFEIWYSAATLFTHVNIKLPDFLEKKLRQYIVTPGMHRIHHSDNPSELNKNFGFGLSLWDRYFKSYCPFPAASEAYMIMGLEDYRDPKYQTLENMLWMPFHPKHLRVKHKKAPTLEFQEKQNLLNKSNH